MNPLVIIVPVVVGVGAGLAYFFWPKDANAQEPEPFDPPLPPDPSPDPAPPTPDDTERPPNISGMPMGWNAVLLPTPAAVCNLGHVLGYNFSGKKPGDPGYGTPQVCDSFTKNTQLAWKDFQRDWNKVSKAGRYKATNVRGLVPVGYKDQRYTLRAMEIANKQAKPWQVIVAEHG